MRSVGESLRVVWAAFVRDRQTALSYRTGFLLSIVASVALAAFGFVVWILLTDPGSGTSIAHNPGKLELAVGVYALAGVIYLVAAAVRRSQGIDIRLAYQELPPE